MGKRDQFKLQRREAKALGKRRKNVRSKIVRFLIVCEGTETEPNYFKAFIDNHYSAVLEKPAIKGTGRSTCSLVKWTREKKEEIERASQLEFDRVWVVFDKDDNDDFDKAIGLAGQYGFQSAWSNEAFELWFLLHFQYLDTAVSRTAYIDKIESKVRSHRGYESFRYQKSSREIYGIVTSLGDEQAAVSHARRLRAWYGKGQKSSECNPCTTVDCLIEELRRPEVLLKGL